MRRGEDQQEGHCSDAISEGHNFSRGAPGCSHPGHRLQKFPATVPGQGTAAASSVSPTSTRPGAKGNTVRKICCNLNRQANCQVVGGLGTGVVRACLQFGDQQKGQLISIVTRRCPREAERLTRRFLRAAKCPTPGRVPLLLASPV